MGDAVMSETEIRIPTPDGKRIYGVLRGDPKTMPLVVFVHGLTGNMNEVMFYEAARIFEKAGFASFRFNLYGPQKDARKLQNCTLAIHGEDIDAVLDEFYDTAPTIYIAGHSYGFPSLLHANLSGVNAIASWDGTFLPNSFSDIMIPAPELKGRLFDVGYSILIGDEMIQEAGRVSSAKLLADIATPTLFCASSKGSQWYREDAEKLFASANGTKDIAFFPIARHGYTENGAIELLCTKTIEWFRKY